MNSNSIAVGFVFIIFGIPALIIIGSIIISSIKLINKKNRQTLEMHDISKAKLQTFITSISKDYKIVKLSSNVLFIVNNYNCSLIYILEEASNLKKSLIDGKIEKHSTNEINIIDNPDTMLDLFENKIKNKIKDIEINKYILLGGNCISEVPFQNKIIRMSNYYYTLNPSIINEKYNKEKVEEIMNNMKEF